MTQEAEAAAALAAERLQMKQQRQEELEAAKGLEGLAQKPVLPAEDGKAGRGRKPSALQIASNAGIAAAKDRTLSNKLGERGW